MNISRRRMMIWLLLCLWVFMAQAYTLRDFCQSRNINAPKTAILVVDLKTGDEQASHNADLPLIPASIMKCVTTATLLEKVGHRYLYETAVSYSGEISGNTLLGDIVVKASGDPSINTANEPGSTDLVAEIVEALEGLRIDSVSGSIVIDESDFPGAAINPTWQSGDLSHAYGTGTHGFNFEDNASGKKSVSNPAGIFKARLHTAMLKAGIKLGDNATINSGREHSLITHRSERMDDIMRSCMMRSDNQFAEAMMRTIGLKYGKSGSTETGTSETERYWQRNHAHMDGVKIVDGSGLSRSNRVTARFMADVLRHMSGNPYYASFFPLAGQEGTLKKFMVGTPLEGEIALKTGSMNGIQCYAGYKLDYDFAPTHLVVVIMNEMGNRAAARQEVARLLTSIFHPETEMPTEENDSNK